MNLNEVIWKSQYVEKLAVKHFVSTTEVEEVLLSSHSLDSGKRVMSRVKICIWLMGKLMPEGIW